MYYMSEIDIAMALQRHSTGNKAIAARVLAELCCIVNDNSDGWHCWRQPVNAAQTLMKIISSDSSDDDKTLRTGLQTVSRFCSRRGLPNPAERFLRPAAPSRDPEPDLELTLGLTA
jgi:hypothetical protein